MNKETLIQNIKDKKSFLCVGLDSDIQKIPRSFFVEEDPVFAFNKAVIDATKDYAVAYKINTAFYEAQGIKGWLTLGKTLDYIPKECFTIADAKRGDIGNTAEQYAKTFFETYPFDSMTVAPYMGKDSVQPFLSFQNRWAIVLALTSNRGNADFQMQEVDGMKLYEKVLKTTMEWGSPENLMFVVGATQPEQLAEIRKIAPDHFFLIPGVGTQGGDVKSVAEAALTKDIDILVNVSRAIIFAGGEYDFQAGVAAAAADFQKQMLPFF